MKIIFNVFIILLHFNLRCQSVSQSVSPSALSVSLSVSQSICIVSQSVDLHFQSFSQSVQRPDLDLAVDEQLLHGAPVPLVQPGVVHADAERQRQLQVGVPHCGDDGLDLYRKHTTDSVFSKTRTFLPHSDRFLMNAVIAHQPNIYIFS